MKRLFVAALALAVAGAPAAFARGEGGSAASSADTAVPAAQRAAPGPRDAGHAHAAVPAAPDNGGLDQVSHGQG